MSTQTLQDQAPTSEAATAVVTQDGAPAPAKPPVPVLPGADLEHRDLALRTVLANLVVTELKAGQDTIREEQLRRLQEEFLRTGSMKQAVRVGDDTIADLTLIESKDSVEITDEGAYTDYMIDTRGETAVETITIVRPATKATHLKGLRIRRNVIVEVATGLVVTDLVADPGTGEVIDPGTGEVVPGHAVLPKAVVDSNARNEAGETVERIVAGARVKEAPKVPESFRVSWKKGTQTSPDGKDLAVALLDGRKVNEFGANGIVEATPDAEASPVTTTDTTEDWTTRGTCRTNDPDELFVQGTDQQRAKVVCRACPVRTECLADALDGRVEFGVWGGMTERERRALLKRRPNVQSWGRLLQAARAEHERTGATARTA